MFSVILFYSILLLLFGIVLDGVAFSLSFHTADMFAVGAQPHRKAGVC